MFLIIVIIGVEDLSGGDDIGAGELERPGDNALVDAVATGKALDLHDEDAVPAPRLDLGKKLLHLRAVGDGIAGDDLLIDFTDGIAALLGKGQERFAVGDKHVGLTAGFGFQIGAGFAEVDAVLGGHGVKTSCEKSLLVFYYPRER